jgi:cell division septum initiation protein DivIVA
MPRRDADKLSNFDLAMLGYDRRQVDRHLDELHQHLADAAAAFDAAAALQHELNAAHNEIADLRAVATSYPEHTKLGERVTEILMLAEEQAAAILAEAEREAERLRAEAQRDAEQLRAGQRVPDRG